MRKMNLLNDFVFKKIFGEVGSERILISFLNAVLEQNNYTTIEQIEVLENKELLKDLFDDKTGIIDVRAKLLDGTIIHIEVQLTNQHNMEKRTLFYISKLYHEYLKQGGEYKDLSKVISINIIDFNYLPSLHYQSIFQLTNQLEKEIVFTDLLEIHFIELPKFRKVKNKNLYNDSLVRWLTYLSKNTKEETIKELMNMDDVFKEAEVKYDHLCNDPESLRIFWGRERSMHERANLISTGIEEGLKKGLKQGRKKGMKQGLKQGLKKGLEQGLEQGINEGIKEGIKEEKYKIAAKLIDEGMDLELVIKVTELSHEDLLPLLKNDE